MYPIHNGSCHKQQMNHNDKFNHGKPQLQLWIDSLNEMFLSMWTAHEQWNINFILLKSRRGRRASVREFITRQTCKICDHTVDYMCPTTTSKSPHAFAYQNRSPQAGKRENWQFVDLSRLQFTSDESEFIPDYI